jgi:hypothetical protein
MTIEKAHIAALSEEFRFSIESLVLKAPNRAKDFILELDPSVAAPAIIFRDFPKLHGNIIQRAVGMALNGHIGGLSETEKKFKFLTSVVSVDNFFLHSSGQIYLFETKRDMRQVRDDAANASARKLGNVADAISANAKSQTGRNLRHPIICAFFSFVDPGVSYVKKCEIGSPSAPNGVSMTVFGRTGMNKLIGKCFGQFIDYFDSMVGGIVSDCIPAIITRPERKILDNPLLRPCVAERITISADLDGGEQAKESAILL